ncbi:Protein of unknown function [Sphingomonas gellani]|uniref:DUF2793 domain-containing protein n=1 Tax=Sphingomonas gellani TaxID=1166340 RepID=A0A1H8AW76_9SPHN|nr:DUF2793 domain-containing protein [Sphingomonas gellani]SEM74716.1 Protein of unknown function [Sphingomonas gellani]
MNDTTARFSMSMLQAGQAQKELTHNEALAVIDTVLHAKVVSDSVTNPPSDPEAGQCWIVPAIATGVWQTRGNMIASWTQGGWHYVAPVEGMLVWNQAVALHSRWHDGRWITGELAGKQLLIGGRQVVGERRSVINPPRSGSVVDVEARVTIEAILEALVGHGLIAA